MVETALFSIFHREPTQPQQDEVKSAESEALPAGVAIVAQLPAPESVPEVPAEAHDEKPDDAVPDALDSPIEELPGIRLESGSPFDGEAYVSGIEANHELLGLANPDIFTVNASYNGERSIDLTAERSGIYRPRSFRAAPWSGFAYDQASDGLTGLAAGTRLLTARGEVPVEGLLPGDSVLALRGPALLPITWVGRSSAAEPPILIEQGALGPNCPRRPLYLAPNHPVFIDPIPVPARQLVNGTTIRATSKGEAELFHVDVGAAEVLFAEGVALSSGNRPSHPA